jgi:hypothetical protein
LCYQRIAQCLPQRRIYYGQLPRHLRPGNPPSPSLHIPSDKSTLDHIRAFNEQSGSIYREYMAVCIKCGRRFEPDRLPVHLRGCREQGNFAPARSVPRPLTPAVPETEDEIRARVERELRASIAAVMGVGIQRFVVCYCCGRRYTTQSHPIHLPLCVPMRKKLYRATLPRELWPPMPVRPRLLPIPTDASTLAQIEAYNEAATQAYRDAMAECPVCERKFEPDRLSVHMRGCTKQQLQQQQRDLSPSSKSPVGHRRLKSTPNPASDGHGQQSSNPVALKRTQSTSVIDKTSQPTSTTAMPTPTALAAAFAASNTSVTAAAAALATLATVTTDDDEERRIRAAVVIQRAFRKRRAKLLALTTSKSDHNDSGAQPAAPGKVVQTNAHFMSTMTFSFDCIPL